MALTMSAWEAEGRGRIGHRMLSVADGLGKTRKAGKNGTGSRSKNYAIILAHFFTAIFFAWVNLCKKDCARRPGFEGVPHAFRGTPEVAQAQSLPADFCLEGGIEVKGLHIIADLYNCQKGELLVSSGKLPRPLRQCLYRRRA